MIFYLRTPIVSLLSSIEDIGFPCIKDMFDINHMNLEGMKDFFKDLDIGSHVDKLRDMALGLANKMNLRVSSDYILVVVLLMLFSLYIIHS